MSIKQDDLADLTAEYERDSNADSEPLSRRDPAAFAKRVKKIVTMDYASEAYEMIEWLKDVHVRYSTLQREIKTGDCALPPLQKRLEDFNATYSPAVLKLAKDAFDLIDMAATDADGE